MRSLLCTTLVLFGAQSALGSDLSKIDRTIAKGLEIGHTVRSLDELKKELDGKAKEPRAPIPQPATCEDFTDVKLPEGVKEGDARAQRAESKPPKIMRVPHEGLRTAVAFSPDSKTLATGAQDNHVRLWDVATRKPRLAIAAHLAPAGVSRLAYFPDGKTLASASWAGDGTVKLWDVATGKEKQRIGQRDGGISVLAVSSDGKFLAWGGGGTIHLHDVKADREARTVVISAAVDSVAFSPDSSLLATADGTGTVLLWQVGSGESVGGFRAAQSTATGSQAIAFSRDGKLIATASRKVKLWQVATGEEVAELGPADETPFYVVTSPDGRYLAAATNKALRLWDWQSRKEIHCWPEVAASVAFSRDGRWLAFGSRQPGDGVGLVEIGEPEK